jgi:hypothetical protein
MQQHLLPDMRGFTLGLQVLICCCEYAIVFPAFRLISLTGSVSVSASNVQFYQKSEKLGAVLATHAGSNGTDMYLHIEAPTSYQWAALGTGDAMDGSFMIVMQHSGDAGKYSVLKDDVSDVSSPHHRKIDA